MFVLKALSVSDWAGALVEAWLAAPRKGNLSLVSLPVAESPEHGVKQLAWIHWDDLELKMGRFVRLAGREIIYTLPMDSSN